MRLRRITLAETAVLLLLMTLLASMYALNVQQSRAEVMVLSRIVDNASVMSQFAHTAHSQYSQTIGSIVRDGAVELTTDDDIEGASLHFPHTFTRILTQRFSDLHPSARLGVFSDDPFETQRDRVLDGFSTSALAAFRGGSSAEYWRVEDGADGGFRVRYATPITMREGCVDCHNRASWGLKNRSWEVGDVRGVWEVTLDVPKTELQSVSEYSTLIALQLAACLLGALMVFPAVRREVAQRSYFESLSINLNELAETDSLSGLANRRAFDRALDKVFSESTKSPENYGLIVLNVDHFNKVNDTYGHDAGDAVIATVSKVIAANIRPVDFAARVGGEEFAVICPNINQDRLSHVADRIRNAIEAMKVDTGNVSLKVTISAGATMIAGQDDRHTFYKRADRQLYKAKDGGRNRVQVAMVI